MDELTNIIRKMNKDLDERRRLFDSIQPFYIGLILIGFGSEFSDETFLKAAGIKST